MQPIKVKPDMITFMKKLIAAAAAFTLPLSMAGALVIAGATVAQASSCSSATGGDNDRLIKAANESTDSKGYNCAYVYSTGNKKIGAFAWNHVTSTAAKGYSKVYDCKSNSGGVSVSPWYVNTSSVADEMNWDSYNSQDGSRHWTGAILWMTKSNSNSPYDGQYNKSCSGYTIYMNALWETRITASVASSTWTAQTGSVSVTVSAPDNSNLKPSNAPIYIMSRTTSDPADDTVVGQGTLSSGAATVNVKLFPGSNTVHAVLPGSNYKGVTLPNDGWIPGQSSNITVTVNVPTVAGASADEVAALPATKSARALAVTRASNSLDVIVNDVSGKGPLTARCPTGTAIQTIYAGSDKAVFQPQDISPVGDGTGATIQGKGDYKSMLQVVCRSVNAKAVLSDRLGRGSIGPDHMVTTEKGTFISGGLGDDVLVGRHTRTALDGGFGNDVLKLKKDSGALNGGPGDDMLTALGSGSILVGGVGHDTFTTSTGAASVNARDGHGGDVITCGSSLTKVLADKGDLLYGDCTVV